MSTEITHPQPASRLPQFGLVTDWSFIKGREQYVAFVAEWKEAYRYLSVEIRARKLTHRASQSNAVKPGNERSLALIAQIPKAQPRNHYVADNLQRMAVHNPAHDRFLATWLIEIRAQAKVKAQQFWKEEHKDELS
jgi:hypothetical protein